MTELSPDYLIRILSSIPRTRRYCVAYSGGPDSHALLHLLANCQLDAEVLAIHVDHGLQLDSRHWVAHCDAQCRALGVPFESLRVAAQPAPGESLEAFARERRYTLMRELIRAGDVLLTAHTQDDQSETLLLQLFRGAGPAGLSAMPTVTSFGVGWLARPLLSLPRSLVHHYAEQQELTVVRDPSNDDLRFDRNFLRRKVLPQLESRWPALSRTLSRAASHQAQAALLLEQLGKQDLATLGDDNARTLSCQKLAALEPARRHNLVRTWISQLGFGIPPAAIMHRIDSEMLVARADSNPVLGWGSTQLRSYRERLYLMSPLVEPSWTSCSWNLDTPLQLPHGRLSVREHLGEGIAVSAIPANGVRVRLRQGGERCRPAGRRHSQTLKRLFQAASVEPWLRHRIPLIYIGEDLAAVAGYWVCAEYAAKPGEVGRQMVWRDAAMQHPQFPAQC